MAEKAKKVEEKKTAKIADKEQAKQLAKAGLGKLKNGGSGFMNFIKEQNIVGLAVGLVLGTHAGALVNSLINNVFMPPLGLLLGSKEGLVGWTIPLGDTGAEMALGAFLNDLINFIILALVIYIVIKALKLDVKKK
ncbi:MscL family protein [Candidatus Saccharibacteria bacterium]|nr:MscL family protein [Candidatus Saccharibacteria bacterium]